MLENLMQSYLDAFGKGWRPHDESDPRLRDWSNRSATLSSPQQNKGNRHADIIYDGGRGSTARFRRLRQRWVFGLFRRIARTRFGNGGGGTRNTHRCPDGA